MLKWWMADFAWVFYVSGQLALCLCLGVCLPVCVCEYLSLSGWVGVCFYLSDCMWWWVFFGLNILVLVWSSSLSHCVGLCERVSVYDWLCVCVCVCVCLFLCHWLSMWGVCVCVSVTECLCVWLWFSPPLFISLWMGVSFGVHDCDCACLSSFFPSLFVSLPSLSLPSLSSLFESVSVSVFVCLFLSLCLSEFVSEFLCICLFVWVSVYDFNFNWCVPCEWYQSIRGKLVSFHVSSCTKFISWLESK